MKKRYGYIGILMALVMISGCEQAENKIENERSMDIEGNVGAIKSPDESMDESFAEVEDLSGNGLLFATEYRIEDYCQGCFIVSKNDGLLYGVLNKKGEEILPVKYDDISFLNSEAVENGENGNLYIKTQYEDIWTVVNREGQQILDKNVLYMDYKIGAADSESAFFYEKDEINKKLRLYKEDGSMLLEKDWTDCDSLETRWLTKDKYLLSKSYFETISHGVKVIPKEVVIIDQNDEIVNQWNGTMFANETKVEEKYVFWLLLNDGKYYRYALDEAGNISEEGESTADEMQQQVIAAMVSNSTQNNEFYLGEDKSIKLYESNNTWKLVDANGAPLYDERYYECFSKSGCYFLVNEDNQMCLIDRNGNLVVDYGWLTWNGDEGCFNGMVITSDNFFAGDDGVCFVQGGEVYFFQ